MINRDILTVQEVADQLRVNRSTVWRWCVSGQLEAVQVGRSWRVPRQAVDEFVGGKLDMIEKITSQYN